MVLRQPVGLSKRTGGGGGCLYVGAGWLNLIYQPAGGEKSICVSRTLSGNLRPFNLLLFAPVSLPFSPPSPRFLSPPLPPPSIPTRSKRCKYKCAFSNSNQMFGVVSFFHDTCGTCQPYATVKRLSVIFSLQDSRRRCA